MRRFLGVTLILYCFWSGRAAFNEDTTLSDLNGRRSQEELATASCVDNDVGAIAAADGFGFTIMNCGELAERGVCRLIQGASNPCRLSCGLCSTSSPTAPPTAQPTPGTPTTGTPTPPPTPPTPAPTTESPTPPPTTGPPTAPLNTPPNPAPTDCVDNDAPLAELGISAITSCAQLAAFGVHKNLACGWLNPNNPCRLSCGLCGLNGRRSQEEQAGGRAAEEMEKKEDDSDRASAAEKKAEKRYQF